MKKSKPKLTDRRAFDYVVADWYLPDGDPRPLLPVTLHSRNNSVETWGLLDGGADMNMMPFAIGMELGLSWERSAQEFELLSLAGSSPAKAVEVDLEIALWPRLKMAFAWSTAIESVVILGQWNFFEMVDVCFSRRQGKILLELPG